MVIALAYRGCRLNRGYDYQQEFPDLAAFGVGRCFRVCSFGA